MDQNHIQRLKQEQINALEDTNRQIEQWDKFKSDYKALKTRLKTLPDKVSHDVMVPFGKLAFMPGRLVHTNEVLVLLGDNWFAERSAKQAAGIVDRRMQAVDEQLTQLAAQKKLLDPRIRFTSDLQSQGRDVVDITEEYDEGKEKAWKAQHKQNVKKHRQSEKRKEVERKPLTNEELWARLDELHMQERKGMELQRMTEDGTEVKFKINEDIDESSELNEDEEEDDDIEDSYYEDSDDDFSDADGDISDDNGDDSSDVNCRKTSRIYFSHQDRQLSTNSTSSNGEEVKPGEATSALIQSPADIYKQFSPSELPHSILKTRKPSPGRRDRVKKKVRLKEHVTLQESREKRNMNTKSSSKQTAFSSLVVEKPVLPLVTEQFKCQSDPVCNKLSQDSDHVPNSTSAAATQPDPPRRVSKFRAERQKQTDNG